jgi:hypothetical protein
VVFSLKPDAGVARRFLGSHIDTEPSSGHHAPMSAASQSENLPRVLSVLELLTEEELYQLNQIVIRRLRLMQQIRAHGQMMNLRLGQRVQFNSNAGALIRGTIARHNRKSVTVVTDSGEKWTVAPALLKAD